MKYLAIILTILILILLSDKAEAAGQWVSERTQTWHVAVSGVISYHESVEEVWAFIPCSRCAYKPVYQQTY